MQQKIFRKNSHNFFGDKEKIMAHKISRRVIELWKTHYIQSATRRHYRHISVVILLYHKNPLLSSTYAASFADISQNKNN